MQTQQDGTENGFSIKVSTSETVEQTQNPPYKSTAETCAGIAAL